MKENWGLYNSNFEHDACGIGAVVNIKGKKSNKVINDALDILEKISNGNYEEEMKNKLFKNKKCSRNCYY